LRKSDKKKKVVKKEKIFTNKNGFCIVNIVKTPTRRIKK